MQGFTLYSLGRIENTWVTDGLSEILSTFIFAVRFIYNKNNVSLNVYVIKVKKVYKN